MGIVLAFAPFIGFALVDRFAGSLAGLATGAALSAILIVRDALGAGRSVKLLEIGTFVLFAGMAAWALLGDPGWSVMGVRLRVDAGLLAIVLATMALRRPFTLQYAREQVPPEHWNTPGFLRTNMVISGAWALAFVVMVLADVGMLLMPEQLMRVGILVTIAALIGAIKFTQWYPERTVAQR
ncbi:hypothetical protein [Variovorax sp. KK3]|uniref:hypothetical protein n=1 Tax=Variovorax sp. KK3 TaxID=1855728 RepID=UPI00097C4AA3|nr:hypothetical protein [Variovorax sp. KK3]